MKFLISIVSTIAVAIIVMNLNTEVRSLITGPAPSGPKTVSVAKAEEENAFVAFWSQSVDAAKMMLGIREPDNRSDLKKLLDRRRKETTPMQGFDLGF